IVEQHERAGGSPFDLESHAELEGRSRSAGENESLAPALPPAAGAGVSSREVSDWLRAESAGEPAEPKHVEAWPAEEEPAAPAEFAIPVIPPPSFVPYPPPAPPRFGGGQAARSDDGSRRALWAALSVAAVALALGGWWLWSGRSARSAVVPAPSPAAVRPQA